MRVFSQHLFISQQQQWGPPKEKEQRIGNLKNPPSLAVTSEPWPIGIAVAVMSFPTSYWLSILQHELWFSVLLCDWVGPLRLTKFSNKDHISSVFKRFPIPLEWNAKFLHDKALIFLSDTTFYYFPFASYSPITLIHLLFLLHARHVATFQLLHFLFLLPVYPWTNFSPRCPYGFHISLSLGSNAICWNGLSLTTLTIMTFHLFSLIYSSLCCLLLPDIKWCICSFVCLSPFYFIRM